MTDPITCPECHGKRGTRLGRLFLACIICGGRGIVGGEDEPGEPKPPPVWESPRWADPTIAWALPCRYCLGAGQVTSVNHATRTMTTTPCTACA